MVAWFLRDHMVLSDQWARPFSPTFRPRPGGLPTTLIPRWYELVRAGEIVRIDDAAELDDRWAAEQGWLASSEIRASLTVPIVVDDEVAGFVMADDDRPRIWSDIEVARVKAVADRLRRDDDRASADEVDWATLTLEDLPLPVAAIDVEGDWVFANRRMRELASRPGSVEKGAYLADVTTTDIERLRTVVRPVLEGRTASTNAELDVWGRAIAVRFFRVPPMGSVRGLVMATPAETTSTVEGIDVVASIATGAVRLAYQPVVDTHDRVVGAEALIRIDDPVLGEISPGVFIQAAERTGTAPTVDRFVVARAIADHGRLRAAAASDRFTISVNLSASTLRDGIAADIERAALAHGVPFDAIQVEVTETQSLAGHRARHELRRLAELGVAVALDDFGTGYTSFDNLVDLPLTAVKLDRTVLAATHTHRGEVVARGVCDLAAGLGLGVIAEGVETARERAMVARLGCSAWQGYRCSPAVAPGLFPGAPATIDV